MPLLLLITAPPAAGSRGRVRAARRPCQRVGARLRAAPALGGAPPRPRHAAPARPPPPPAAAARRRASRPCAAAAAAGGSNSGGPGAALRALPMALTLARVAAVPALAAAWHVPGAAAAAGVFALFAAASATDFLDGWLARRLGVTSALGAFLDPVADKLMVAAVLILLAAEPPSASAAGWAAHPALLPLLAVACIGREIAMSALRELAATLGPAARGAVAVSWAGKCKTAAQMAALALLLAARGGAAGALGAPPGAEAAAAATGLPLLAASAALALWSLGEYLVALWPSL